MHGRSIAKPVIVATLICGSMVAKANGDLNAIVRSRSCWSDH
jgi:hypothetical protein